MSATGRLSVTLNGKVFSYPKEGFLILLVLYLPFYSTLHVSRGQFSGLSEALLLTIARDPQYSPRECSTKKNWVWSNTEGIFYLPGTFFKSFPTVPFVPWLSVCLGFFFWFLGFLTITYLYLGRVLFRLLQSDLHRSSPPYVLLRKSQPCNHRIAWFGGDLT